MVDAIANSGNKYVIHCIERNKAVGQINHTFVWQLKLAPHDIIMPSELINRNVFLLHYAIDGFEDGILLHITN